MLVLTLVSSHPSSTGIFDEAILMFNSQIKLPFVCELNDGLKPPSPGDDLSRARARRRDGQESNAEAGAAQAKAGEAVVAHRTTAGRVVSGSLGGALLVGATYIAIPLDDP
jgi:hypothetical protein